MMQPDLRRPANDGFVLLQPAPNQVSPPASLIRLPPTRPPEPDRKDRGPYPEQSQGSEQKTHSL